MSMMMIRLCLETKGMMCVQSHRNPVSLRIESGVCEQESSQALHGLVVYHC